MNNLPIEIISNILKYLPSINDRKVCSLVCRTWYEAYLDSYFRHQEVLHISEDSRFHALCSLKNERKYMNVVIEEVEIQASSLKFWKRFGPYLKNLSFISCDIREKLLVNILSCCKCIESLSLKNCRELFMVGHFLDDPGLRINLKEKMVLVKNLNLSYNRYLSDAIFSRIVSAFINVCDLNLSGCQIAFFPGLYKRYYPEGQLILSENVLTFPIILNYMTHNAKALKNLSFSDTCIDNSAVCFLSQIHDLNLTTLNLKGCFQLSHEAIKVLVSEQKSLTVLDLSMCPRITDGSLLDICANLCNLNVLSVQGCRAISDLGVVKLSRLTKLKCLNLSECGLIKGPGLVEGLCENINKCLKELRLAHLENLTCDAVVSLSAVLPNLRLWDLGFCQKGVTNRSLQSILQNNASLNTLILTQCLQLTDGGLTGMGSHSNAGSLDAFEDHRIFIGSKTEWEIVREAKMKREAEEIRENDCQFSGNSLKDLKGLRYLDLSGCSDITDLSLIHCFRFDELRLLNLNRCSKITGVGLKSLAENSPAIESLDLNHCLNVDDHGVFHLLKNLNRLEALTLGSNKITDSIASTVKEIKPGLIRLDIRQCGRITKFADIANSLPRLQTFQYPLCKLDETSAPVPPDSGPLEFTFSGAE